MGWGLGHARSSHTAFSNPTDPVSAASALSLLGYPACSCRLRPSSRARPYRCLLAGLSPGVMNSINPTGPLQIRRSGRLNQEETGEAIKNSSTILRVPTTLRVQNGNLEMYTRRQSEWWLGQRHLPKKYASRSRAAVGIAQSRSSLRWRNFI